MSKKQLKHLEKARRIKANKHKDLNTSEGVLNTINTIINNMDLTSQANSNGASNTINALINYQRLLKEYEQETGHSVSVEPIKVVFVDSNTPLNALRIDLLSQEVASSIGNGIAPNRDTEKKALAIIRKIVNAYTEILNFYDENNNRKTNIKELLKVVESNAYIDQLNIKFN